MLATKSAWLQTAAMHPGEWLTRGAIWLALSLYAAGEIACLSRVGMSPLARWLNTLGCVAFLGHVAFAFHFYHHWSHLEAYAETARQTVEFTGWNWGVGLFINYFFALVWLGEAVWAWAGSASYGARSIWVTWCVRVFFLFMIFNGAVVFVRGPARWLGLVLCVVLVVCCWQQRTRIARAHQSSKSA